MKLFLYCACATLFRIIPPFFSLFRIITLFPTPRVISSPPLGLFRYFFACKNTRVFLHVYFLHLNTRVVGRTNKMTVKYTCIFTRVFPSPKFTCSWENQSDARKNTRVFFSYISKCHTGGGWGGWLLR